MQNIDLSKIKKEYLALICMILIAVITFLAYKNTFAPMLARIKKVSAQIEQRKMNIQKAKVGPQALKKLEKEVDIYKSQVDYYQQKLKAKANMPQILRELNQMAERLKIKFVSVNPLERKETLLPGGEEFLLQIPIRIKLECEYHQLGIFINQIENSLRLMKITELKISADSKNIWTHQAELVITSYLLVSN